MQLYFSSKNNFAALVLALFLALPTTTQSALAKNPEGLVSSYISSQLHRLKLSAEQKQKFRQQLSATSAKRRKIFNDLGIKIGTRAGYTKLIKLRSRIMSIVPSARRRAASVLSAKQLTVYAAICKEVAGLLQKKLKA